MTEFIGADYTADFEQQTNGNQEPVIPEVAMLVYENGQETQGRALTEEDTILATETEWIEVRNIRRYKATIAATNVAGDTFAKKINNVSQKINHVEDYMGCKIIYIQNKAHVSATFGRKDAMEKACDIKLFEDNDFKLNPIQNRGDEEVRDKTVVIRDLPLDVDRSTLKTIMERIGKVTDVKLQISGLWYKAYVTYETKEIVETNFINKKTWSIFYLKDLCRVAPANIEREEIDERNKNTLKLTDLPFGTTAYDLRPLLERTNAKTCFIPRTRNQYGRARYAFITFEDEEMCIKLLKNDIKGVLNGTELHWVTPDVKTCHKCGSMEHLVMDCQEKKDNDEFKQRRQGFNRVYTKYRVPNYKNLTKTNNANVKQQEEQNGKGFNQQMINSMNAIQQSIKEMNATLTYLNQRITKIEKQVGIKTPTQINITSKSNTEESKDGNNNNQQINQFNQQGNNKISGINIWTKPVNVYNNTNAAQKSFNQKSINNNGKPQQKRVRLSTSSSESEAESSTPKEKGKSILVATTNTKETNELNDIKDTQQKLQTQVNTITQQLATIISMCNANNK